MPRKTPKTRTPARLAKGPARTAPVPRARTPQLALAVSASHDARNLSVFFLTDPAGSSGPEYAVLEEAIRRQEVRVGEQASAQVQRLAIENLSEQPLFLHEGERLRGGRQDRTVRTSLVIPARSGRRTLPALCIEQTRWSGGGQFSSSGSALAPRAVRLAAKVNGDQAGVWKSVAATKARAKAALDTSDATSSLNEVFDSPQVQRAVEVYVEDLRGAISAYPQARGVAFALGGALQEVDVYASPALLARIYPRLLEGFALEAVLAGGGFSDAPSVGEVEAFLKRTRARSRSTQAIDPDNALTLAHYPDKVECLSLFQGRVVHHQILRSQVAA